MGIVVDKVALGQVFLRVLRFSPASIIPTLLHIHLSPPHEVCDNSDKAAHYHNLGPKLGASLLTRNFDWKQNKKVNNQVGGNDLSRIREFNKGPQTQPKITKHSDFDVQIT
jgi:hypothetical protein